MAQFIFDTVFKRDVFSETSTGHFDDAPGRRVIRRNVEVSPWWSRLLARYLAFREVRALKRVKGIIGVPELLVNNRSGIYRTWTEGAPLQLARPDQAVFYRDARRLLRDMRRRGVTHNDLAKPQNWLMTPQGDAAVIDFQLASVHRWRGALFRLMAYEDLRHLIKQKRSFAPDLLTAAERRVLARKSLPARVWLKTGKPVYNFITRSLFHWSDGEGTNDRLELEGPSILAALQSISGVREVVLLTYAQPAKGTGLYAFVECQPSVSPLALQSALAHLTVERVQTVAALPRGSDGSVRMDLLRLVALNQMTEIDEIMQADAALAGQLKPIIDGRLNLTDRRDVKSEG